MNVSPNTQQVQIECLDGDIPHPLPTCTRTLQPCEAPTITGGIRDPHNKAPGDLYQLQCEPGYSIPVTLSEEVRCRAIPGYSNELL